MPAKLISSNKTTHKSHLGRCQTNRVWCPLYEKHCWNNLFCSTCECSVALPHTSTCFLFVSLDVRAHLRFAYLEKSVLYFLIYFAHRFPLTQMCVRILLILSAMCSTPLTSGTDAHIEANILLSVKEHTYSSCMYVLYNGEQGTLFRTLHNQLHQLHGAEWFFTVY
jgi:hypothetical protein